MVKLRLCILYKTTDKPWGGSNTFFRNFHRAVSEDASVEVMEKPEDADIILSSGHYQGPGKLLKTFELRNLKSGRPSWHPWGFFSYRKRRKIIFRVDGLRKIYAQNTVPADEILLRHLPYADAIIYQSRFSQQCFEGVSDSVKTKTAVIENGTRTEIFFPNHKAPDFSGKIILISSGWSTNPRKGFKVIADFSKLPNVRVKHIGRWPDAIPSEKVELLGAKKEEEIGPILRTGHFFLFPSENEACPNVVVEALACGLPVLYHPSGGTAEIVEKDQFGMPLPQSDESEVLVKFLAQAVEQYPQMRKKIEETIERWNFSRCYKEYRAMFERILHD